MSTEITQLWKHAYNDLFGGDPDEDAVHHRDVVETWRIRWEAAYTAGEDWARRPVSPAAPEPNDRDIRDGFGR